MPDKTVFKKPPPLVVIGAIYLLLPAFNVLSLMARFRVGLVAALLHFPLAGHALMLAAPVVAVGLFRVRRWAYFLFLGHAAVLLCYNLYFVLKYSHSYYWLSLFQTGCGIAVIGYFLRREVSAPYLSLVPRGWRHHLRQKVVCGAEVDGKRHLTNDLSETGCFLVETGDALRLGQRLRLALETGAEARLHLSGRVIRLGPEGCGVRFNTRRKERRAIRQFLSTHYPLRFRVELPVAVSPSGHPLVASTFNISRRGLYLAVSGINGTPLGVHDPLDLTVTVEGKLFTMHGTIAWVNLDGNFGKPAGIGVALREIDAAREFRRAFKKVARTAEMVR